MVAWPGDVSAESRHQSRRLAIDTGLKDIENQHRSVLFLQGFKGRTASRKRLSSALSIWPCLCGDRMKLSNQKDQKLLKAVGVAVVCMATAVTVLSTF